MIAHRIEYQDEEEDNSSLHWAVAEYQDEGDDSSSHWLVAEYQKKKKKVVFNRLPGPHQLPQLSFLLQLLGRLYQSPFTALFLSLHGLSHSSLLPLHASFSLLVFFFQRLNLLLQFCDLGGVGSCLNGFIHSGGA